ncbi:MAG: hypothetical protein UZ14_CFX002000766 [Chloroflexi bacterium OLB14]|nr:MAG: hypothetical protein UZ14_CFX002000766 [Chloroflexi bacterium OLB14]
MHLQAYKQVRNGKSKFFPHDNDYEISDKPTLILNNPKQISCNSRNAVTFETSLEDIQKQFENYRVFDYQIISKNREILWDGIIYLNPFNSYLLSKEYLDINGDGGFIIYPNLLSENKIINTHQGSAVLINEPQGGIFQLHYWVDVGQLKIFSGVWEESTSDEVAIQIFLYRENGFYEIEKAYIVPNDRKIRWPKNYDFKFYFTLDELRDALGTGNEFYIRFLDKDENIIGEDYFYIFPSE